MKNERTKGYLMVFASGLMWGTIGLFTTMLSDYGLSSTLVSFLRLGSGVLMLGLLMLLTRGVSAFKIDARGLLWCVLLGIFPEALQNVAYTRAVNEGGMAVAAVLLYTAPVFVCVMSRIFFREKISGNKVTGLVVNIAGCLLAVTGGSIAGLQVPAGGVFFGVAAGFCYALLTVISTAALRDYDPLTVLFYGMLIGSMILGTISRPWQALPGAVDLKMLLIVAVFGFVPTCAAYMIYMQGLNRHLEASRVPVIASVEVVVSAALGILVFSQNLNAGKLAGIALILLSIVIMNVNIRRPALRHFALPRISAPKIR